MAHSGKCRGIDVASAREILRRGDALLLDMRDAEAFRRGHIEGARLATIESLPSFRDRTAKERPIIVYCYRGVSSEPIAGALAAAGFLQVFSLDGGYEAWAAVRDKPEAPILSRELRAFLAAQGVAPDDLAARDRNGATPLMHAVRLAAPALVQEMLRAGADIDATNADGNQALWLACAGEISENIQLLINAGAELQHVNFTGATPLMFAASSGRAKAVALLLAAGADPLFETELGWSALDMAATAECLSLMREAVRRRKGPPARE